MTVIIGYAHYFFKFQCKFINCLKFKRVWYL